MPNLASALKGEIRRLARKEIRESVTPLRKLVTALRKRVAQQRRLIADLERNAKRSTKNVRPAEAHGSEESQIRFSPAWVKHHRKKLKMSRRVYAKLVGVSAQSVFGWESGRTRPRRTALEAWRRIRRMGLRELKELTGGDKAGSKRARRGRPAKRRRAASRPARRIARRRAAKKK